MLKKTLSTLLLGLTLTAGCDALGLGGNNSDNSGTTTKDDRISHDRGTARDNRGGFDMKYPADFDNGVPSGARLVREVDSRGGVSYKTPHDGRLYVYDVDSRRMVWSGAMRDGERFTIDSQNGRATIEGQSINNRDLNADHQYRLYFVEGSRDSVDTSNRSNDRYDSNGNLR